MPSINSPGVLKAARARPVYDGKLHTVSETILIPAGTVFAATNTIRLFRVDPNKIIPTRFVCDFPKLDGNATPTLTGDLGYLLSANRAGTNISFTLDASGNPTAIAATADPDFLVVAAATPVLVGGTAATTFGSAGATGGIIGLGGVAVFNTRVATSLIPDSRGYDANVLDVAITLAGTQASVTASAGVLQVTMEFLAVGRSPNTAGFDRPYVYDSRYSLTTQLSS